MLSVPEDNGWGTRRKYLIVMLCQLIGAPMFVALPNTAILHGALGFMLGYLLCYFILGIPLLYMEFVICQFTARDCIDVWKARSCFSHIGYILVTWQALIIISNHVNVAFILHYLLISFENPIPYYTCGDWASQDCNILTSNYSVNRDCIRRKTPPSYCGKLFTTFPEYQYWRHKMLGVIKEPEFHIAWRVCLASALICVMTFFGCFQGKRSVKRVVNFFTLYPITGYSIILVGSMLQKGVVTMYNAALDTEFRVYSVKRRTSLIIMHVLSNLSIGSGFNFNLGSGTSFRTPCYSNTVIVVVICAGTTILTVCTTAMMACPYAYEYEMDPYRIINTNMALIFQKIPRFLYEYDNKFMWIVLTMSSHVIIGMSTNMLYIHHLLEMAGGRYVMIARNPGLATLAAVALLYLVSIPLLGYIGVITALGLKRFFCFVTTFTAILEILIFVLWYGVEKFSEDVHFMQGLRPKKLMKVSWIMSCAVLCYALSHEFYYKIKDYNDSLIDKIGWCTFLITLVFMFTLAIIKLLKAAFKRTFNETTRLDPSWGPKNEVMQRSRAMFTAQAMTKEYLYRQYHLQAGVLRRQRMSNCRTKIDI